MKLIKPSYKIWEQNTGLEGVYKMIEYAGRVCYKSEDKVTEGSAKAFVDKLISLKHGAMLEHGTVYLKVPLEVFTDLDESITYKPWNRFIIDWQHPDIFLTTNYRWIIENHLESWLQYICEPTEFHEKRITVKFILSRSIAQEFTRHRVFSFAMESQRYCNYNKDKFNNEITFIKPYWLNIPTGNYTYWDGDWCDIDKMKIQLPSDNGIADNFLWCLHNAESQYMLLVNKGWKPQQAREVLPNACKTELVMTGFISQWKEFFKLRDDTKAHPQAQELAKPLHEEFIFSGYIAE